MSSLVYRSELREKVDLLKWRLKNYSGSANGGDLRTKNRKSEQ